MSSSLGTVPIQSFYLGIPNNVTIAQSMAGTGSATVLSSSVSCAGARGIEVFNLTGRNIDLIIGKDNGTASYSTGALTTVGNGIVFCPGTATATPGVGRGFRIPCAIHQGMSLAVRSTENTPITCAATTPLIISLWT